MRKRDKEFSAKRRETLAKQGKAMPGGGFPIENRSDLENAIKAFGRAKNPGATKAWIRKRARALGATELLPENWDACPAGLLGVWRDAKEMVTCSDCYGTGVRDGAMCDNCQGTGYEDPDDNDDPGDLEDDDDPGDLEDDDYMEDAASRRQFRDVAQLLTDGVRYTRDGYLVADARISRTGIQEYAGEEVGRPDMSIVRVYRSPEEVFSDKSMASMAHRPITFDHPPDMVDAGNWKRYSIGHIGDEVKRDGDCVRVPMVIMDAEAIDAFKRGVRQLSVGYSTELKWGSGTTPDGQTYDAKQTAIRGNHLAVVPAARGGSRLTIGDYTAGDETMKVLIAGQSIEFATELAAKYVQDHIATLEKRVADARKKMDEDEAEAEQEEEKKLRAEKDAADLRGQVTALTKQLGDAQAKLTGATLDAMVKERSELIAKADAALEGKVDLTGKEPAEIRRTVAVALLGDSAKSMTDDEVSGAFKALTANVKPRTGTDRLADGLLALGHGGGNRSPNSKEIKDAAYAERVKVLNDAWKMGRAG